MSNYLFVLFLLACPLMMIFMMRGMHGGHGDNADNADNGHEQTAGDSNGQADPDSSSSLDDLRRQRDELDRQIEEREGEEQTPVRSGWR